MRKTPAASLPCEVSLGRILKYLNLIVAVLLVCALVAVWWYAWRVLPQTAGEVTAPLRARATVVRDRTGMPHITAASLRDAVFLQGYVSAQDRLWQMDALRRFAAGRLSDVVGAGALEIDRESRRLRIQRVAELHAQALPSDVRALFAAYASGVNHFIDTHRDRLPVEFSLLGYDPEPWTVTDCVLAGTQMFRDLTTSWKTDLEQARMLAAGDPKLVAELYPMRAGGEVAPGSNAWAIASSRSVYGKPILANDTHLEHRLPSTWYMVHLRAPGLNVAGVSLPGLPMVIIGHNDQIAWGVTNLQFDVQDLYAERMNPQSGVYVFRGQAVQAPLERELIPVRESKPVEFSQRLTQHGPVITAEGGRSVSLRWTAAEPGNFDFPFVQLNSARDWESFRAALRRFPGPNQNFVYADAAGNIGYQAAGRMPIRTGHDGQVPADGSLGTTEWNGYIPFEQLPSAFNPPSGMIVSANQNPFPADYPHTVAGDFAPRYRSEQIRSLLASRPKWDANGTIAIQKDVYSPLMHFLARQFVASADKLARGQEPAADILRGWNGQMEKDSAAAAIVRLGYDELRARILQRATRRRAAEWTHQLSSAVIETLVRERPARWFGNWDTVLLESLRAGVATGGRTQGSNLQKWTYGRLMELEITHPVVGRLAWVGKYFNIGPEPMSGSGTTVKQLSTRLGPSMRFVAVPGAWDQSMLNITAGESGQPLSSHYKDQWADHYYGRGIPMPWTRIEGDTLTFVPAR